jgi:hypothetical protein
MSHSQRLLNVVCFLNRQGIETSQLAGFPATAHRAYQEKDGEDGWSYLCRDDSHVPKDVSEIPGLDFESAPVCSPVAACSPGMARRHPDRSTSYSIQDPSEQGVLQQNDYSLRKKRTDYSTIEP